MKIIIEISDKDNTACTILIEGQSIKTSFLYSEFELNDEKLFKFNAFNDISKAEITPHERICSTKEKFN